MKRKKANAFEQVSVIASLLQKKPKVVNFGGHYVKINGKKFYARHYYLAKAALRIWKQEVVRKKK